jgi:hypothetical protein
LLTTLPPEYDPMFLTGNFKRKKHRVVMQLPGVAQLGSVIAHVNSKDRRKELNSAFHERHDPWLTMPKMSLSKAKRVEKLLLEVCLDADLDLELSTAALAYAYFERLVLQNVVSKYNRKIAASVALLLAVKYNEPVTPEATCRARLAKVLGLLEHKMHVRRSDVLKSEVGALVYLHFDLEIKREALLHIFDRMLAKSFDPTIPDDYEPLLSQHRDAHPSMVGPIEHTDEFKAEEMRRKRVNNTDVDTADEGNFYHDDSADGLLLPSAAFSIRETDTPTLGEDGGEEGVISLEKRMPLTIVIPQVGTQ